MDNNRKIKVKNKEEEETYIIRNLITKNRNMENRNKKMEKCFNKMVDAIDEARNEENEDEN